MLLGKGFAETILKIEVRGGEVVRIREKWHLPRCINRDQNIQHAHLRRKLLPVLRFFKGG